MATSLIALNDKGFWAPDSLLEIFAFFLAEELSAIDLRWSQEYAQHLRNQATSGLTGCIDFQLSALGAEAKQVVSKAAEDAVLTLKRDTQRLTAKSLTALYLGGGAVFTNNVDFCQLDKLKTVFQQLLSGNWRWGPGDDAALPRRWLQEG